MSIALPVEIIEDIMHYLWALSLSAHERATFMKSSLLVCKMWSSMYLRIFCEDVHLPSRAFALRYLRQLQAYSLYTEDSSKYPLLNYDGYIGALSDRYCRSITFQHDPDMRKDARRRNEPRMLPTSSHSMGSVIVAIFRTLSAEGGKLLPHLRRISIVYNDTHSWDLLGHQLLDFPRQVKELDIDFKYTTPAPLDARTVSADYFHLAQAPMENLHRLHVTGVDRFASKALQMACPNLQKLETDSAAIGAEEVKEEEPDDILVPRKRPHAASRFLLWVVKFLKTVV